MSFQEQVTKHGFGRAVVLEWAILVKDQQFIDSLTLEQWIAVYYQAAAYSQPQLVAVQKIRGLAKTIDQWVDVYRLAPRYSRLQKLALQKVQVMAHTFDEWFRVYERAPHKSQLWKLALQKTRQLLES